MDILKGPRQEGAGIGRKSGLLYRDGAKASDIIMGTAHPGKEAGWSRSRKPRGRDTERSPKGGVTGGRCGIFRGRGGH